MTTDEAWHVPELGQSLGIGLDTGGRVLTRAGDLPPAIRMFNGGIRPLDAQQVVPTAARGDRVLDPDSIARLVPAQEGSIGARFHETHLSGLACQLYTMLDTPPRALTVSAHGVGATGYGALRRGTVPFANLLKAVTAHAALARQEGLRPVVPFVTMVHGEHDSAASRADYAGYLAELLRDIQREIPAITGQDRPPFLAVSQIGVGRGRRVSDVALAQLDLGTQNRNALCCGPKYQWVFSDKVHLTSESYRMFGEMMGKSCARHLAGQAGGPLHLIELVRQNPRRIALRFRVPVPPLRLSDSGPVSDPGAAGIEVFRLVDHWRPVPVESLALQGDDGLVLRLGRRVDGMGLQVRVAMQKCLAQGPDSGARSLICDSDQARGVLSGAPLINWCAHGLIEDLP